MDKILLTENIILYLMYLYRLANWINQLITIYTDKLASEKVLPREKNKNMCFLAYTPIIGILHVFVEVNPN